MISLAKAHRWANTSGFDMQRAEAMGFTFSPVEVKRWDYFTGFNIRGSFRCVCGQEEFYHFIVAEESAVKPAFNVGWRLEQFGSFSRQHLIADGYSPQAVAEMWAKRVAFERKESGYAHSKAISTEYPSQTPRASTQETLWRLPMGTQSATGLAGAFDRRTMARSGTRGR